MVPEARDGIGPALIALASPTGVERPADAVAPLDGPDAERFTQLVIGHGLVGALVDALQQTGRPVDATLAAMVDDDRFVRLRVAAVLRDVGSALDDAGIGWLAFKGPLVARLMARPELRSFNDLDLLVAADRFSEALDVLAAGGVEEVNQNWVPYLRHRVGEVPLSASGITVDLHWHTIGLRRVRRTMRLSPDGQLARRRRVAVADSEVSTFDPADQLIHLAVHTALSGARRLDQLRDIAVVLAADPPSMDDLVARARDAGVARLVAQPLDRARMLLDAPIGADVVARLGGRTVTLRRWRETSEPHELTGVGVTVWRDSPVATARAVRIRVASRLGAVFGRERGWDFNDPESPLFHATPTGGPAGRAEYLRGLPQW